MPNAKRVQAEIGVDPAPPRGAGDHRYVPGGTIAELQADIARRLSGEEAGWVGEPAAPSAERVVRALSVGGGYLLLTAGYAATALLVVRYW